MVHKSTNILALSTLAFIRERMVEVKWVLPPDIASHLSITSTFPYMTQLLLLGKFEYTGGPIFKVVLEC